MNRHTIIGWGCALTFLTPIVIIMAIIGISALVLNPRTNAPSDFSQCNYLVSPPPPAKPITLKIVTFNIADAYLFTTNRPERIRAIARILTELDPDIVGLQECFIAKDRALLLDLLAPSRLHHHAWYPAATVGNGLLTLSAYPIVASYFHRYQHNNSWYKIHHGDWWAGKGIGLARIELPCGGLLDFYNTHAQAGRGDKTNAAVRYEQMGELADFLNASRTSTGIGLMVGDFNTRVGRPDFERAVGEAGLELMMTLDPGIDFIFALQSPVYKYEALDTTVISGETQGSKAAIFLSRAPSPGELWRMLRGPGETTSLSDHSGYMSTIRISPTEFPEQ